jgi:predicted AAA+ superfamily ATPase
MTGSSARKLRRGGVNLLAGRALLTHFHPFLAAELGTDFSLNSPDEIGGMALEGLVLQHLKAWCDYSDDQVTCYFWRSRGGSEVDFELYGEHHFHALEVKNPKQVHPKSL